MIASLEEATVDMLIDVDSRQWNSDLVDGIFAPEESTLIKKIPLERCDLWQTQKLMTQVYERGLGFLRF